MINNKSDKKKSKYIPPRMELTVLECEDVITSSNGLSTSVGGTSVTGISGASWSTIYGSDQ